MMELALSLEKLNFRKLRALHDVAVQHNDPEMADFLGAPRTGARVLHTSSCLEP